MYFLAGWYGNTSLIDLVLIADTSKLTPCSVIPPLRTSDHIDEAINGVIKPISGPIWSLGT